MRRWVTAWCRNVLFVRFLRHHLRQILGLACHPHLYQLVLSPSRGGGRDSNNSGSDLPTFSEIPTQFALLACFTVCSVYVFEEVYTKVLEANPVIYGIFVPHGGMRFTFSRIFFICSQFSAFPRIFSIFPHFLAAFSCICSISPQFQHFPAFVAFSAFF